MKFILKLVLALTFLFICTVAGGYIYIDQAVKKPLKFSDGYIYHLKSGSSLSRLAHDLTSQGVLESPYPLLIYARFNQVGKNLHAGEYELSNGISSLDLIQILEKGQVLKYYITFVEGWSFREIFKEFKSHKKLEVTLDEEKFENIMSILGKKDIHPEGQFFPDTYQYQAGMTDVDVLKRAHDRLNEVLDDEWNRRSPSLPFDTKYQALIMASLVEKETGAPQERPEISGVFSRRLKKRMRLETDPTVIYGLGKDFKGNITKAHLRKKTAYNTYRIHGLPPSPIALVGREAINAAVNPKEGTSLYFVAKGDGTHYFSDTYDEHLTAVRKYQIKQRKKDYRSSPASE